MLRQTCCAMTMALTSLCCAPADAVCLRESADTLVLHRGFLDWPWPQGNQAGFEFVISAHERLIEPAGIYAVDGVQVDLFSLEHGGCVKVYSQTMPHVDGARAQAIVLGAQPVVALTFENHGGSGDGFTHVLLVAQGSHLQPVTSAPLSHTNMGGFFAGALGGGRGTGVAVWDALWDSGAHYDPHRYSLHFYRLTGSELHPLGAMETPRPVAAEPNAAPSALGLPFRDQTDEGDIAFTLVGPLDH